MQSAKYVILGGGMVAGYAAKQFVEGGGRSGDLTIVSADDALPYERPPLSKSFLAGKDTEQSVLISPAEFYREHGIEVRLGTRVQGVNFESKLLKVAGSEDLKYEKLVIATGANPRTLENAGREVLYLRSLDDSKRIRDRASGTKSAVVVGGGFIGMEVAAVLAQKGIAVTMVLREDRIWKAFFSPEMSAFFERYYEQRGVQFARNANAGEFLGRGDIAVAGIGVAPVTEIFRGIALGNGVVVNENLEAGAPDVYAAGDVANYRDVLFKKQRRVEHWDNAVSQGQHVARALLGERAHFVHVPYFFSDVFDLSYEFWGDTTGAMTVVHRGDLQTNSFSAWWLGEDNRVLAAFTMNRPDEERDAAPKWIETKQAVDAKRLADPSRGIQDAAEGRA